MEDLRPAPEGLAPPTRAAIAANPLAALAEITDLRTLVAILEREAVFQALENHTWAEIGLALGVSKQAAFQRFGKQWIKEIQAELKEDPTSLGKRELAAKLRRSRL